MKILIKRSPWRVQTMMEITNMMPLWAASWGNSSERAAHRSKCFQIIPHIITFAHNNTAISSQYSQPITTICQQTKQGHKLYWRIKVISLTHIQSFKISQVKSNYFAKMSDTVHISAGQRGLSQSRITQHTQSTRAFKPTPSAAEVTLIFLVSNSRIKRWIKGTVKSAKEDSPNAHPAGGTSISKRLCLKLWILRNTSKCWTLIGSWQMRPIWSSNLKWNKCIVVTLWSSKIRKFTKWPKISVKFKYQKTCPLWRTWTLNSKVIVRISMCCLIRRKETRTNTSCLLKNS